MLFYYALFFTLDLLATFVAFLLERMDPFERVNADSPLWPAMVLLVVLRVTNHT